MSAKHQVNVCELLILVRYHLLSVPSVFSEFCVCEF